MYVFKPDGHGELSYFIIAKSKKEAVKKVTEYIKKFYWLPEKEKYDRGARGWDTDYYLCTSYKEGQVVEHDND